jgi:hypothetical protein
VFTDDGDETNRQLALALFVVGLHVFDNFAEVAEGAIRASHSRVNIHVGFTSVLGSRPACRLVLNPSRLRSLEMRTFCCVVNDPRGMSFCM